MAEFSARLGTDVIWLGFQSVVDVFRFHHWRSGQHLRSLVHGSNEQGVWERIEGQAEVWEREAFFDEEQLTDALEDATDEEAEELRRIWRNTELIPGQTWPMVNARESARAVAEFYRLPGWS